MTTLFDFFVQLFINRGNVDKKASNFAGSSSQSEDCVAGTVRAVMRFIRARPVWKIRAFSWPPNVSHANSIDQNWARPRPRLFDQRSPAAPARCRSSAFRQVAGRLLTCSPLTDAAWLMRAGRKLPLNAGRRGLAVISPSLTIYTRSGPSSRGRTNATTTFRRYALLGIKIMTRWGDGNVVFSCANFISRVRLIDCNLEISHHAATCYWLPAGPGFSAIWASRLDKMTLSWLLMHEWFRDPPAKWIRPLAFRWSKLLSHSRSQIQIFVRSEHKN